ncbi:MAG: membrane protein insertion efficiency factor YidD [Bacteroidota bacterium]
MKGRIVCFIVLFICVAALCCNAQNFINSSTEQLLKQQNFEEKKFAKRKVSFLFKEKKNVIVKYNPVTLTFGGLLFFYQKLMSPQISVDCPYELSCSNFSKNCIYKYGLIKGIALTADRLTRCTQFTMIDIVPIQISKQGKIIDPIENYKLKHWHE